MTEQERVDLAIEEKARLAFYYEELAYSVATGDGQKIVVELRSVLNDLNNSLVAVSMQDLVAPYYEFPKDDLQRMKALRAQKDILNKILIGLDSELLLSESKKLKETIERLKLSESLEPAY